MGKGRIVKKARSKLHKNLVIRGSVSESEILLKIRNIEDLIFFFWNGISLEGGTITSLNHI